MIRPMSSALFMLAITASAMAEETVREISWTEIKNAGKLSGGEVVSDSEHGDVLKIENRSGQAAVVQVLVLEDPGITKFQYAVTGNVRYENIQQVGQMPSHLETWNYFSNGGYFFSRTLGQSGPMGSLKGSSNWRTFQLPFFSNQQAGAPTKIEMNVVFAGNGTVYLSPLRIVQHDGISLGGIISGVVGGIAGTVLGLVGALIGVLAAIGKGRRIAMSLAVTTFVIGLLSIAAGLVTVLQRQPFHVYFPLLLLGTVSAAVMGSLFPVLARRYQQIELRKIAASDLAASEH